MRKSDTNLAKDAQGVSKRKLNTSCKIQESDCTLVGDIFINPTDAGTLRFEMGTPLGILNSDTLSERGLPFVYSGAAAWIKVTPYSSRNIVMINGGSIELSKEVRYNLRAESMTVYLRNVKEESTKNNQWALEIFSTGAIIDPLPRELVQDKKAAVEHSKTASVAAPQCDIHSENAGGKSEAEELQLINEKLDSVAMDVASEKSKGNEIECYDFPPMVDAKKNEAKACASQPMHFPMDQKTIGGVSVVDVVAGIICSMIRENTQAGAVAVQ